MIMNGFDTDTFGARPDLWVCQILQKKEKKKRKMAHCDAKK